MADEDPFAASGGSGDSRPSAAFRQQGDYWTLTFAGRSVLLRNAKGLQYVAQLLRQPGMKISVVELAAESGPHTARTTPEEVERARSAVTKRIRDALLKIEKNHPTLGQHLSARIRTGYECSYSADPDRPVIWEL